ncbi:MAG: SHOCT domain-containing protein, partial [Dermatophilaceae bacterium]
WVVFPLLGLAMMIVMMVFVTTMVRGRDQGSSRGWGGGPQGRGSDPQDDQALEVLRRRYAAGELNDEDFEQRRAVLMERR